MDFSQKVLLGKALHSKSRSRRAQRLRLYAVLTGVMGLLISIAHLILVIRK